MTHTLRIASSNCQTFSSNKELIHKLIEKRYILLLQETLITDYNSNELDLIAEGSIALTYMSAKQCTNQSAGRPSSGLGIFWSYFNNLTLGINFFNYVILNVYMKCDCRTL